MHMMLEYNRRKEAGLRSLSVLALVRHERPLRFLHAFINSSRRFSVSMRRRSAAPQGDLAGRHLVLSKLSRSSSTGFPDPSRDGRSSSRRSVTRGNLSSDASRRRSSLPATGRTPDRGSPRPRARSSIYRRLAEASGRDGTRRSSPVLDRGLPLSVRPRSDGQGGRRIGSRRRRHGANRHPRSVGCGSISHPLAPSYTAYRS